MRGQRPRCAVAVPPHWPPARQGPSWAPAAGHCRAGSPCAAERDRTGGREHGGPLAHLLRNEPRPGASAPTPISALVASLGPVVEQPSQPSPDPAGGAPAMHLHGLRSRSWEPPRSKRPAATFASGTSSRVPCGYSRPPAGPRCWPTGAPRGADALTAAWRWPRESTAPLTASSLHGNQVVLEKQEMSLFLAFRIFFIRQAMHFHF